VHHFELVRKMAESGLPLEQATEPMWGTCDSTKAVHNFDDQSGRHVITHEELFLGHFQNTPRLQRTVVTLDRESALGNFDERLRALSEEQARAEAKRCMSCGMCFECDNCVVYCPQKAVFKVKKGQSTTGRYVDTDYGKCIGCHICHDVCPTGYIQMGLGE
jgi:Pyruvate/2-oxoacid:ferredoxin oxidoreductase delta subunit